VSNDIRSPLWVTEALLSIGSGGRSARALLTELLAAFNSEPLVATATTAQLAAIGDPINTSDNKVAGYVVWNSTASILVVAAGAGAGDVWNGVHDNLLDHTPI